MGVSVESWLEVLEQRTNVDVDYMDPAFTLSVQPFQFNDMTSNQTFVHEQMCHPDNASLLRDVVSQYKTSGWLAIYTHMAVLMCKANISNIKGRVLLQTLPTYAYNCVKTVEHARAYAREFEAVGISKDRFCIKIPATGPGLRACQILAQDGIRTLGTAVFSVHQAIAASQAGCLYISPYYNEPLAHVDRSIWPQSDDPALLHPFSPRLIQILDTYKRLYKETGREQPLVKLAGFLSTSEAMAASEIGCHSATISHQVLKELWALRYVSSKQPGEGVPKPAHPYANALPSPARLAQLAGLDPLAPATWNGELASADVDYLANNGENLDAANNADPETKRRIADALEGFVKAEKRSQSKIQGLMEGL
ncbi:hypothetical protein ANOM_001247 [Aspergillus nomiae NRRL 13137]|uniref:Transaldolase n=1 Tax=Aspergillus nomiae NRRL (strain ATCC 15546 / NRRL 13137 / CBS 260.88 / M93) TaxID=1509407 RepID=A0A0L1JFA0_ASPN3|nr:uncharacterized protein ANOM_001247 [Aspergillus nomiae NRRL 13137]KNG90455.1 hypothetical protein ANOM_001247 [Aspergillus nomiae NRRL 13137]